MRRVAGGVGVALAVSFPAVVLGAILVALDNGDDRLPPVLRALLVTIVLLGPVVGGAVLAHDRSPVVRPAVGAIALLLIVAFGLARQAVADDDGDPALAVAAVVVGGGLGWFGGVVGRAWPGRTRP